jgi:hypothetical protein
MALSQSLQRLRDDFNRQRTASDAGVVRHGFLLRVGISDWQSEPEAEWKQDVEFALGAIDYRIFCWHNLPTRFHPNGVPVLQFFYGNADRQVVDNWLDLRDRAILFLHDGVFGETYRHLPSWMMVSYFLKWDHPATVRYKINERSFSFDGIPLGVFPFQNHHTFEEWERGTLDIPAGRYYLTLGDDVRACSMDVIDALTFDAGKTHTAATQRSEGNGGEKRRGAPPKKTTKQRADFAKPLVDKGQTWLEIFNSYATTPKGKEDKGANPDAIRLAYGREYPAK